MRSRRLQVAGLAVCAVLAVGGLAACGGSDEGDAASKGQAAKQAGGAGSGDALKVMAITSDGTQILNTPEVWAGAQAGALRVNDAGGIQGQKVEIITCNSKGDVNASAACARQAVQDGAIAVLSPTNSFTQNTVPVLEAAKIPFLGSGSSPDEQTKPNSFPMGGGGRAGFGAAAAYWLKNKGVKDIAIGAVQTDVGIAIAKQVEQVVKDLGANYKGTVTYPLTTQDFAPIAQKFKSTGATGVINLAGQALAPALMQASKQIGYTPLWAGSSVGTSSADAKKYASALQGIYLGGSFPPPTVDLPAMKLFREDAAAVAKQGVEHAEDNQGDGQLQAWLMVQALAEVANALPKGTKITGPVMLDALSKAHDLDLQGLGTWNPGGPGLPDAPQITNGNAYLVQVQPDGSETLVNNQPINVFKQAGLLK